MFGVPLFPPRTHFQVACFGSGFASCVIILVACLASPLKYQIFPNNMQFTDRERIGHRFHHSYERYERQNVYAWRRSNYAC